MKKFIVCGTAAVIFIVCAVSYRSRRDSALLSLAEKQALRDAPNDGLGRIQDQALQDRRARFAREGDRHVVAGACDIFGGCDETTVGAIRRAGYSIVVGEDGEYRMSKNGVALSRDEFKKVVGTLEVFENRQAGLAREGDRHVVHGACYGIDVACDETTVGAIRKAGYSIAVSRDGEYQMSKDGVPLSHDEFNKAVAALDLSKRAKELQAKFALEGGRHVVYGACYGIDAGCDETTVGVVRKAGYSIAVSRDGEYQMSKDGAPLSHDEFNKVVAGLDRSKRVKDLKAKFAREGDRHVVEGACDVLDGACDQATVGAIRKAGYAIAVDEGGEYRMSKDGVAVSRDEFKKVVAALASAEQERQTRSFEKARHAVPGETPFGARDL